MPQIKSLKKKKKKKVLKYAWALTAIPLPSLPPPTLSLFPNTLKMKNASKLVSSFYIFGMWLAAMPKIKSKKTKKGPKLCMGYDCNPLPISVPLPSSQTLKKEECIQTSLLFLNIWDAPCSYARKEISQKKRKKVPLPSSQTL